jgi:hypothetical protein
MADKHLSSISFVWKPEKTFLLQSGLKQNKRRQKQTNNFKTFQLSRMVPKYIHRIHIYVVQVMI